MEGMRTKNAVRDSISTQMVTDILVSGDRMRSMVRVPFTKMMVKYLQVVTGYHLGHFEHNLKQGIGYLFNPRHKKYYQNVYDQDVMIEENEKKEPPQELKRVIKAELLKRSVKCNIILGNASNNASKGDLKLPKLVEKQSAPPAQQEENQELAQVPSELKKSAFNF
jgi:hypothetical protein